MYYNDEGIEIDRIMKELKGLKERDREEDSEYEERKIEYDDVFEDFKDIDDNENDNDYIEKDLNDYQIKSDIEGEDNEQAVEGLSKLEIYKKGYIDGINLFFYDIGDTQIGINI